MNEPRCTCGTEIDNHWGDCPVLAARQATKKEEPSKKAYYLDIEVQEAIIDLRVRHGLTQENLAKLVGTKQESIARAESRGIASLPFLKRIAAAVGERVSVTIYAESKKT